MLITYASHHNWKKPLHNDPLIGFSSNNQKRIVSTLKKLTPNNITFSIERIGEDFLQWFEPKYQDSIATKANPNAFDVRSTIKEKADKFDFFSFSLHEENEPIGGTIFSKKYDRIAIAYRAYDTRWSSAKLQASPAYLAEYLVTKYAVENGFKFISHGKDSNPYGINSGIGLCIYKLSIGCRPSVAKYFTIEHIDTSEVDQDFLVLELPESQAGPITDAHLFTSAQDLERYQQVTKYPELLNVTVHVR